MWVFVCFFLDSVGFCQQWAVNWLRDGKGTKQSPDEDKATTHFSNVVLRGFLFYPYQYKQVNKLQYLEGNHLVPYNVLQVLCGFFILVELEFEDVGFVRGEKNRRP